MIATLLLFGATGDLASRFLLPGLAALVAAGKLPDGFRVVGAARQDWDDAAFRRHAAERLDQHAAEVPAKARETLLALLSYRPVDLADTKRVAAVIGDGIAPPAGSVAAYLALPPSLFATTVAALGAAGLPPASRIAVEKPFGDDLESASTLNMLLTRVAGSAGEQAIFRVDHVLGMATVQNLIALRLANRVIEAVWDSAHIEQIDILWEETLALEGRAGYYDRTGALKDVMQNHMLQLLSLVAMEPPASLGERDLRDRKVAALRSVRPLTAEDVASRTRRARYIAGRLADTGGATGRDVPDYAAEEGVDPERGTETYAEVLLDLDSPRWADTRFLLRAGKAMMHRRKGIVVRFRPSSHQLFGNSTAGLGANELWIGVDGPEDIRLHLTGGDAGLRPRPAPLSLTAPPPASDLPAYSRVLFDILSGDNALSVGADEALQAWRVVSPVLRGWAEGLAPLEEYPAGSAGPPPRRHTSGIVANQRERRDGARRRDTSVQGGGRTR